MNDTTKQALQERADALKAELEKLNQAIAKIKEEDPVVESGEFFGMRQRYIYPVPDKDDGCRASMYSLAERFNQREDRERVGGAEGTGNKLKIYKVSLHKSGKFSVENTGKVFDPWGEQTEKEYKPIGELVSDLKVGDKVKVIGTINRFDNNDLYRPIHLQEGGWLNHLTLARKVN